MLNLDRKLNSLAFGTTVGMVSLLITAILDVSDILQWMVVWPIALIGGCMTFVLYNIVRDMALAEWKIKNVILETKVDFFLLGVLVVAMVVVWIA